MTGSTGCGRTLVAIGMTLKTVYLEVSTRERESCLVMVKCILSTARRVAGQTGCIFVNIAAYAFMTVISLRIQMTYNAGKFTVVICIAVAFGTFIPGACMCPAVNGKVLLIMLSKTSGLPARIRGVTTRTVIGKAGSQVVGVCSSCEICYMTGKTIGWRHIERSAAVAAGTILYLVPFCQGKKVVIDGLCFPVDCRRAVAVGTGSGKSGVRMSRIGRSHEIALVAIDAGIADAVELELGFGNMTLITVGRCMRTQQRKSVVNMQFGNVVH